MILELNGIDVECIIGERVEERTRTQRLLVDVRLEIGEAAAYTADAFDETNTTTSDALIALTIFFLNTSPLSMPFTSIQYV